MAKRRSTTKKSNHQPAKSDDQHFRSIALQHAVTIGTARSAFDSATITTMAAQFLAFLKGEEPKAG